MKNKNTNISIVDGIWKLLANLSTDMKKELVERLNKSINSELTQKKKPSRKRTLWVLDAVQTAEELCKEIRESRTINSERETFLNSFFWIQISVSTV